MAYLQNFLNAAGTLRAVNAQAIDDWQDGIADRLKRLSNQRGTDGARWITAAQRQHTATKSEEHWRTNT